MSILDERVVKMGFDNSAFERNVATSLGTLDKLKAALNFKNVGSGLTELASTAKNISFEAMSNSVAAISDRFSALGIIGMQVLTRIGDKVADVAEKTMDIAKSLTLDQISSGWDKYAEKTTAVQTIMAATGEEFSSNEELVNKYGTQIEWVSDQLGKLNMFSDETSYSFVDMTSNIGKFTAAGQKLDDSVAAMQGIAAWAAVSGQNASTASRAMYNISQAMGTGAMKAIDWKSIENFNMSTMEFKEAAIDAAIKAGVLTESMGQISYQGKVLANTQDEMAYKFRDTLQEGWFNTDVMQTVFAKYGDFSVKLLELGDSSDTTVTRLLKMVDAVAAVRDTGEEVTDTQWKEWADETGLSVDSLKEQLNLLASAEYDLGRKAFKAAQEAKTFNDAIEATKDAASTMWLNIYEEVFGNYEEAKKLWTSLAEWLYNTLVDPLGNVLSALKEWKKIGGRDSFVEALYAIGPAFERIAAPIKEAWETVFPSKETSEIAEGLKKLCERFAELLKNLDYTEDGFKHIKSIFESFFNILKSFKNILGQAKEGFSDFFDILKQDADADEDLGSLLGAFARFGKGIQNVVKKMETFISTNKIFQKTFSKIAQIIKPGLEAIRGLIYTIGNAIAFSNKGVTFFGNGLGRFENILDGIIALFDILWNAVDSVAKVFFNFKKSSSGLGDSLLNAAVGLSNFIKNIRDYLIENDSIYKVIDKTTQLIQTAFGIISKVLKKIFDLFADIFNMDVGSKLDGIGTVANKVGSAFEWVAEKITGVISVISDFIKNNNVVEKILNAISSVITPIGKKLKELAPQIKEFAESIDFGSILGKGLAGATVFKEITKLFKTKENTSISDIFKGIVDAVKNFSETVNKVKSGITGFFDELSTAIDNFNNGQKAQILKNIALAMIALAISIKILSSLNLEEIGKGLGAVASGLGLIVGSLWALQKIFGGLTTVLPAVTGSDSEGGLFSFVKKLLGVGKKSGFSSLTTDVLKIAGALVILAIAMKIFSTLSIEELAAGFVSMALTLLVIFTFLIGLKELKLESATTGLVALSIGILILSYAMRSFATLSLEELSNGFIAMAGALLLVVGALYAMSTFVPNAMSSAAAILILSIALIILVAAITALALVSTLPGFQDGLLSIAVALLILGVALYTLSGCATQALIVAAAFLILSIGILAIAGALVILSLMPTDNLTTAFLGLGGALLVMMIALFALSGIATPAILVATAFLILSAALLVTSIAMVKMATALAIMPPAGEVALLGLAMIGLAAGLKILSAAALVMLVGAPGLILGGIGLIKVASALAIMPNAGQVALLGSSMISLAAGITALAAAMLLMMVATPAIAPLAIALGVLSVAFLDFGKACENVGQMFKDIATSVDSLSKSGDGIKSSAKKIAPAMLEIVAAIKIGFKGFASEMKDIGEMTAKNFIEGFEKADFAPSVKKAVTNVQKILESYYKTFLGVGINSIKSYANGINSSSALAYLCNKAKLAAMSYSVQFQSAGIYCGQGFAAGLRMTSSLAYNAGFYIAGRALAGLTKRADVNSPSKEFAKIGDFCGTGFANGIESTFGKVSKVSEEMAEESMLSVSSVMDKIADIVDSEEDFVIRPILDASSVKSGISTINSLLSGSSLPVNLSSAISSSRESAAASKFQNEGASNIKASIDPNDLAKVMSMNNQSNSVDVKVNFEGSLSQLAAVLQPAIVAETNRRGPSLINMR